MKTLEDLREFYNTTLLADLEVLERQRKDVVRKIGYVGIVVLCVALPGALVFGAMARNSMAVLFPIIISAVIGGIICYFISKGYVAEFKSVVIRKIIHFIDEGLSYSQESYVPKSVFMMSKIFTRKPNRYKGDDLVFGKVGETKIKFSELNAVYESGSGKNKSRYTVFKGLFFIGDFNKHFSGQTVVLPDTAEKLFGRLGQKLQSLNVFRGQLVKLEDPEFERHFAVYGSDQVEARYILSTSLMKRIVDFKEKTRKKIYLSFIGSMVFVAIWYTKNLFEPRIFRTLLDFEPIKEYFGDLQLVIGIVDDLNLNTRIWSK